LPRQPQAGSQWVHLIRRACGLSRFLGVTGMTLSIFELVGIATPAAGWLAMGAFNEKGAALHTSRGDGGYAAPRRVPSLRSG